MTAELATKPKWPAVAIALTIGGAAVLLVIFMLGGKRAAAAALRDGPPDPPPPPAPDEARARVAARLDAAGFVNSDDLVVAIDDDPTPIIGAPIAWPKAAA
jgi:hypothetical protein